MSESKQPAGPAFADELPFIVALEGDGTTIGCDDEW